MSVVTIKPDNHTIEVVPGETLADAAWRQGFHWPSTCWGKGECMACAVVVLSDLDQIIPAEQDELQKMRDRLPYFLQKRGTRLACRLKFMADHAVVEKNGVRPVSPKQGQFVKS